MASDFQQGQAGYKGEAFLDVGALLPMYCGVCKGDGCDTCDGEGVVLVRVTQIDPPNPGTLESDGAVKIVAELTYDQPIPRPEDIQ